MSTHNAKETMAKARAEMSDSARQSENVKARRRMAAEADNLSKVKARMMKARAEMSDVACIG